MSERLIRTYRIKAGSDQELRAVSVNTGGQGFLIDWIHHPSRKEISSTRKVEGDEKFILSAVLSTDKRSIVVNVEYEVARPDYVHMNMSDILKPGQLPTTLSKEDASVLTTNEK
jgi:hypothetical protein